MGETCSNCNGNGEIKCSCDGKKKIQCHGFSNDCRTGFRKRCPECLGYGTQDTKFLRSSQRKKFGVQKSKCKTCNGKGNVKPYVCDFCNGNGIRECAENCENGIKKCFVCKGRGKIPCTCLGDCFRGEYERL